MRIFDRLLGLDAARIVYDDARRRSPERFERRVLDALGITMQVTPSTVSRIPCTGPLIVAANHPHGALDGLVLADLVHSVRPDVRVLANRWLSLIPELAESCFFVDPFDTPLAAARSLAGLKAAHLWLRRGGALVVFPSGEVAHRRGSDGTVIDSPWKATIGRLALASGAALLPVFIEGANSRRFYAAGRVHPFLRTLLLPRELLNARGRRVQIHVGSALTRDRLADAGDARDVTARVRHAVDRLREGARDATEVIGPVSPDALASEINMLPADACLLATDSFQVFCAEASAVPHALREIGRLRELTYRAAGEGTGHEVDLDAYDERYLHLFLWDRHARRIAGAYRLGRTDRIVAERGIDGLYTQALFGFDDTLIARLPAALELGRSFVAVDYQKNYNALLLLWKGIGRFVCRYPQYRILFGAVSISARYTSASHQMLMTFLERTCLDADLARLLRPVNPPVRQAGGPAPSPSTCDELDALVSRMEGDGKGVPVLLRQYLKLNARLIGFNVDPAFGDALDALMLVDLAAVPSSVLNRYLGRDEGARFLAYHQSRDTQAA